jgi:hypothetical protein
MIIKPMRLSMLPALLLTLVAACQDESTSNNLTPNSAATAAVATTGAATTAVATATACTRECLESTIENYLQALAAQDVARITTTDDVVFAENNQLLALGDGSWKTMTGTGSYRHYFADPQTQQVAVISTMRENDKGVIYDLRLRLRDDKIAEIESMVIRTPGGAEAYETLGMPPANFLQSIPVEQRNSREELLALPYKYLNGMENNDPNGDYAFFADDCNRYEHAVKTTNSQPKNVGHTESTTFSTMTCKAQFSGGGLAFVTRIRDERYQTTMVVDEERQTVFGFVYLDHNGTVRYTLRPDGSKSMIPPYFSTPRGLNVGEAWRVRDNKLLEIEMTLTEVPYGMRPQFGQEEDNADWHTNKNLNSNDVRIDANCSRECLNAVTKDFLAALVSHDPSKLPLSQGVRYHENGVELAVGDGLWGSATALNDYQVLLSNPSSGEAGFYGAITETDVPGLLAARLQIRDGYIQDIDVTVMRHEFNTARGGTLSLFYPQVDNMFTPEQFTALDDGLRQQGSQAGMTLEALVAKIPAADASVRNSRILVADIAQGLLLQQSIRDFSNATKQKNGQALDARISGSYSVLTTTLYKMDGDKVVLMKSVNKPVPYQMPF